MATPATAAADLASVTIDVETIRVSGALTSLTAEVTVEGDQIVRAELTPPGGTAISIPLVGTSFVLARTFASEQELATALPDGEYVLRLNGSIEVAFDFARAPVPSPAISAPLPASTLVPGPLTVAFTRCLACVKDGDVTRALILDDDTDEVIVEEILEPRAESWTPLDGADPFELPEEGSFIAFVQHVALREQALVAQNGDAFDLLTGVSHGDAVPFFTGAAPPSGSFCLVVADDGSLDPLGECLAIDEPNAGLIDPSGEFTLSAGGVEIEYDAEVQPSGAISGTASADLDGNGSMETSTPLRGKLRGFLGKVDRNVAFDFRSETPAAKLAVRIREQASVSEGAIDGIRRAKGTVLGAKVKADAPSSLPVGDAPLSWRLDVTLEGKHVEDASVTLSDGRSFALRGRFIFDFLTDLAKLDLQSEGTDEGVWIRIEDFRIDDLESQPADISSGDFTFKILGQRGRIALP